MLEFYDILSTTDKICISYNFLIYRNQYKYVLRFVKIVVLMLRKKIAILDNPTILFYIIKIQRTLQHLKIRAHFQDNRELVSDTN